jgi:hypothetical protein
LNRSTIGSFSPSQGRNGNAKIRARRFVVRHFRPTPVH